MKIYTKWIAKCQDCGFVCTVTLNRAVCTETINKSGIFKDIPKFPIIPSWCPLPDAPEEDKEERLRPNQLSWEDRHPSDYRFTPVDVSQFLPEKKERKE